MKEVLLVDDSDNIIWYKKRDKLDESDIVRVSVLNIINSNWDTLLSRRSFSKKNNPWECWPAVSWMNEVWETYEMNIRKETKQEIWVVLGNLERITKIRLKTNVSIIATFFQSLLDLSEGWFSPDMKEVIEVKWFSKKEIQKILDNSSNIFLTELLKGEFKT